MDLLHFAGALCVLLLLTEGLAEHCRHWFDRNAAFCAAAFTLIVLPVVVVRFLPISGRVLFLLIAIAGSIALAKRAWDKTFLAAGLAALIARSYAPDIVMSDPFVYLHLVVSNMLSDVRPAIDQWLPERAVKYHGLLHEFAAFVGQALALKATVAYNATQAFMQAVILRAAWGGAHELGLRHFAAAASTLAFYMGTVGVALSTLLLGGRLNPMYTVFYDAAVTETAGPGRSLLLADNPGFYLAYNDLHAAMWAFFLLPATASVACSRPSFTAAALLLLAFALSMIYGNAWTFPMQAIASGLALYWLQKRAIGVLRGCIAGVPLLLVAFLPLIHAADAGLTFSIGKSVEAFQLSPTLLFYGPALLIAALASVDLLKRRHWFGLAVIATIVVALISLSWWQFYIHDAHQDRQNTYVKIAAPLLAALNLLLGLALTSSFGLVRYLAWVPLIISVAAAAHNLSGLHTYHVGRFRLTGDGWLVKAFPEDALLINNLRNRQKGVTIEPVVSYVETWRGNDSGIISTFAEQPTRSGWAYVEAQWNNDPVAPWDIDREITAFYEGTLPAPVEWLKKHQVRYVLLPSSYSALDRRLQPLEQTLEGCNQIRVSERTGFFDCDALLD